MLARFMLVCLALLMAGCVSGQPFLVRDPAINAVWPSPPDPPKIRFLRVIPPPSLAFPAKGKMAQLVEILTGGEDLDKPLVFTPYAVVSDGETVVYVSDPPAGVLYKYDLLHGRVAAINRVGDDRLASPVGLAMDEGGNLYLSDSIHAKVYKLNMNGSYVRELEFPGKFLRPAGIAINRQGEKIIVDVLAQRAYVFDRDDTFLREFPKPEARKELNSPSHVAVDRSGNVYITDSMDFNIKVYDHDGNFLRAIGQVGDRPGSFARPKGVAVDSDGNIFVVDATRDNFQIFNQTGQLLLLVGRTGKGSGEFYLPSGVFIDKHDRIYVADSFNHRVQLFQYLKEGIR